MRLVVQEHPLGCGIACVASRLDIPYKEALRLFDISARRDGVFCKDITKALGKKAIKTTHRYMREGYRPLLKKEGTIVYIKKCAKYPSGHYLLKTKRGWMNPWINFPDIAPAKAGFQKRLPGIPQYVIFEVD